MKTVSRIIIVSLCCLFLAAATAASERAAMRSELPIEDIVIAANSLEPSDLDSAALDSFIIDYMDTHHIPGLAACLVKDGENIFTGSYGYADFDRNIPVSEGTLFMLASISKTVTATALMQLYESGAFELDDYINDYLPFDVIHPSYPNTLMTFGMILSHVSGIKDNWSVMPYYPGDPTTILGEYLESYLTPGGSIYNPNLNFYSWQPGTGYGYCNNALALAGHLVEEISGEPFNEYCNENIFTPLEMNNSAWFLSELSISDIALPYIWTGNNYITFGHYGYSDYPSGQLRTSAVQLARFLTAYLQYGEIGGTRILDSTTVALMTTPYFPQIDPTQGLAWYSMYLDGRQIWGHGGGDTGVTTEMYMCREQNSAVVLLTNGESYFFDIMDALFDYAQGYGTELSVTLTPNNPPIQIPAGGGSFEYDISIENLDPMESALFDVWIDVILPDSSSVSPILLRSELTLPGGGIATRNDMTQVVPAYAPAGEYGYIAYAGLYSSQSVASASFTFEKLAGVDMSSNEFDWQLSGWANEMQAVTEIPTEFILHSPYPNPFNPVTTLSFTLSEAGKVNLTVYDVNGRLITTLVDGYRQAGSHEVSFDGSGLASGMYIYQLSTGEFSSIGKMVLMK
jgi:CubicO group peptidase (beta-lactamase class C family)